MHLAKEQSWIPVCCQRSTLVNELPGGLSQLASCILRDIFIDGPADPALTGVLLKAPDGGLHRIHFNLSCFCQDGQAHKLLFSVKGDSGTRCCILCRNVIAAGSEDLELSRLTSEAFKEEDLVQNTDEDFRKSICTLLRKKEILSTIWQQAVGITYNEFALVFQPDLEPCVKPISQWLHDWMHCFFQKGIWSLVCVSCVQGFDELHARL